MIVRKLAKALGLPIALSLGLAVPAAAPAATTAAIAAGTYTYDTALTPEYYGAGSYEGVLRLIVSKDGFVSGYFRNVDSGSVQDVVGGLTGDKMWLDLGPGNSGVPIEATVEGDRIVGGLYSGRQPYSFVATPNANVTI